MKPANFNGQRRIQRGFMSLQVTLALIISAAIAAAGALAAHRADSVTQAGLQADAMMALRGAAHKLVMENYAAYQAGLPISIVPHPISNPTNTIPVVLASGTAAGQSLHPTVANLRALDFGVDNAQDNGLYKAATNAPYDIRITVNASGHVTGTVCLMGPIRNFSDLAGDIDELAVGTILNKFGSQGGASVIGDAANITSADGSWVVPNPVAGTPAGIVCARFGWGSETDDYLHLQDTRDPNFKGGATVNGIIPASTYTLIANGDTNITGKLNTGGAATIAGATTIGGATQINNTLTVTGPAIADRLVATGSYALGSACLEEGAIAKSTIGGVAVCSGGIWRQLFLGSNAGAPCAPNGSEGTDATGVKLTCVNGVFRSLGTMITAATVGTPCAIDGQSGWNFSGAFPTQLLCRANPAGGFNNWYRLQDVTTNMVFVTAYEVGNGAIIPKPVCNVAGGQIVTPIIQLIPKTETSTDVGFTRYADDNGASWLVHLRDTTGNGLGVAIAQVFCYYN